MTLDEAISKADLARQEATDLRLELDNAHQRIHNLQLIIEFADEREKQLDAVVAVLGQLHPIGEVKAIGYLEISAAMAECLDRILETLDPEMSQREIVQLRERFVRAKSALLARGA